jgi:hypothetical protein
MSRHLPSGTRPQALEQTGDHGAGPGRFHVSGAVVELVVKVDGRADEGHVAEGLGKVPELLAGEADLPGVQAEVVAVTEHLLERQLRLVEPAGGGQGAAPMTSFSVHPASLPPANNCGR